MDPNPNLIEFEENYQITIPSLTTPFENIALAFSGGGFRAASFALGVLSYFEQLNIEDKSLLQHVNYISSASGGTITSAMYSAFSTREGSSHEENFRDFYVKLYSELKGSKLIEKVFAILNNTTEWKQREYKRRNIINAFALAYDELLFDKKIISDITQKNSSSALEEVCFNTTEFYKGLLFRQVVKLKNDPKEDESFLFGNYVIKLDLPVADKLKLSDLLAASSCFPAGFEPIIFPDDFVHSKTSKRELLDALHIDLQEFNKQELELVYGTQQVNLKSAILKNLNTFIDLLKKLITTPFKDDFKFGLMDGGITDNQGLESMIRANERRLKEETGFKPFDLMLVNDVGSHFMKPYTLPEKRKIYSGIKGITLDSVMLISTILTILGFAGLITGLFYGENLFWLRFFMFFGTTLFFIFGIIAGLIFFVKKFIIGKFPNGSGLNLGEKFTVNTIKKMFDFFGSTPILLIISMILERGKSIVILNSSVFLKRIRQLLYQRFYEAGKFENRVKSNHIYDLSYSNDRHRYEDDQVNKSTSDFEPSESMQIVAESAFRVPTTLWFDDHQMDESKQGDVIACAQFTTCYNLLEYIARLKKEKLDFEEKYSIRLQTIEDQLKRHFDLFKQNPYWLINKLGKDFQISDWGNLDSAHLKIPGEFEGLR